jgi:hypothetical protein
VGSRIKGGFCSLWTIIGFGIPKLDISVISQKIVEVLGKV